MLPAFLRPAPDSMAARLRQSGSSPRLHALNLLWSLWVFLTPLMSHVGAQYWWSVALTLPGLRAAVRAGQCAPLRRGRILCRRPGHAGLRVDAVQPGGMDLCRLRLRVRAVSRFAAVHRPAHRADRAAAGAGGVVARLALVPDGADGGDLRQRRVGQPGRSAERDEEHRPAHVAGRGAAAGRHGRARTHRSRPARPAGAHAVADHPEAGAVAQAVRPRSRKGPAPSWPTPSRSRARRWPRCARR